MISDQKWECEIQTKSIKGIASVRAKTREEAARLIIITMDRNFGIKIDPKYTGVMWVDMV